MQILKDSINNSKDNSQKQDAIISKNNIIFSLFEKDSYLVFVYKKTERLVAGVYLITELISDKEPLKWQFRSVAIEAVSFAMLLSKDPVRRPDILNDLIRSFVKMISFCDISLTCQLLSEMNYRLLKKEIENLLDTMYISFKSSVALSDNQKALNEDYFSIPTSQFLINPQVNSGEINAPVFPSDQNNFKEPGVKKWGEIDEKFFQNNLKGQNKRTSNLKDIKKDSSLGQVSVVRNTTSDVSSGKISSDQNRRGLIIGLLKTRSNLTIKDFSAVIKGCSDKTIQRELQSLVKSGVLKKDGERRWSRYSLLM